MPIVKQKKYTPILLSPFGVHLAIIACPMAAIIKCPCTLLFEWQAALKKHYATSWEPEEMYMLPGPTTMIGPGDES